MSTPSAPDRRPVPPPPDHEPPDVPGFRSWIGVYIFVFAWFVAMVLGLTVFTHYFA